jgi:hypothetical protein
MSNDPELSRLERFDILRKVGEGAVGAVYEAFDRERRQRVALKTLRSATPDSLRLLKREFRSAQDLGHPNLVQLGELLEFKGTWLVTMEFVEGVDFLTYVAAPADGATVAPHAPPLHRFDETRLRSALAQLTHALAALHSAQIVHRDVKPSNVLVTAEGRLVLLDFGLALELGSEGDRQASLVVGTPRYMAPEQAAAGRVDSRADWYSVGVMLFAALTGRAPFSGGATDVIGQKLLAPAPRPSDFADALPPDLEALCSALLATDPALRPNDAEVLTKLGLTPPDTSTSISADTVCFVGRGAELSLLTAALERVTAGGTELCFVRGEPGIGKSALVQAFVRGFAERTAGGHVFTGRCYERESVPYKALDSVLEQIADALRGWEPAELRSLLPADTDLIPRAFPAIADLVRGSLAPLAAAPPRNPQELRARVFAAVRTLMSRLSDRSPLVIVVDDLHWADADSLALLRELVSPPNAPRLLLVATERSSTQTSAALLAFRERLTREGVASSEIRVGALAPADALELARRLAELRADSESSPEDAARIASEAAGHPLFIDEIVRRQATSEGRLRSVGLDEAILARVGHLDPRARDLLELVAISGVPSTLNVLARAAELDGDALFAALAALRAGHLVNTAGPGLDARVEPFHDAVREAVVQTLGDERKRLAHARLAQALARSEQADPAQLALFWEGAGELGFATEAARRAAAHATRGLAFRKAADLYSRILRWHRPEWEHASATRRLLADALHNAGASAESAEVHLELARSATGLEALDERREAAEQLMQGGRFDAGIAELRDVLTAVGERLPDSPAAIVFWLLVERVRLRLRGLHPKSVTTTSPEYRLRVACLRSSGLSFAMLHTVLGQYFMTRFLRLALDAGDRALLAEALCLEASYLAVGGSPALARTRALLQPAERLAGELATPFLEALVAVARGYMSYCTGKFTPAKTTLAQAERIFANQCVGTYFHLGTTRSMLYRALAYRGDLRELAERVEPVWREAQDRGDLRAETSMLTLPLPLLALAHDEPGRAWEWLRMARVRLTRARFQLPHFNCALWEAQAELYRGDPERAWLRFESVRAPLRRSLLLSIENVRVMTEELRGRLALARAARAASQRDTLLAFVRRRVRALRAPQLPWADAFADQLEAGSAFVAGHRAEAEQLLKRAVLSSEAADMRLHAAASRYWLGELTGGASGRQHLEAALQLMLAEGVTNAPAFVSLLCPARVRGEGSTPASAVTAASP